MDQKDVALGLALGLGERSLDRAAIGELGLDLLQSRRNRGG